MTRSNTPKSLLLRLTEPQHAALKATAEASGTSMTGLLTNYIDSFLLPQVETSITMVNSLVDMRLDYGNSILRSANSLSAELSSVELAIQKLSGEEDAQEHEE